MKTSRILTVAIAAAAVLAVFGTGSAFAYTWNGQTDVTEYWGSLQANWYTWIDEAGHAPLNSYLSWCNGLNDKVYATVRPVVEWKDDVNGDGTYSTFTHLCGSTLNYNQCWAVIQNSNDKVNPNSAQDIYVDHDYLYTNGNTAGSSGYHMHYYYKS